MTDEINFTLTNGDDNIVISKSYGDVIINNTTNKGNDSLTLDNGYDYDESNFSTEKVGRDLIITYKDSEIFKQNITIKNYFSKDGRSTSSSIKYLGFKDGSSYDLKDLYKNVINEGSYKKNIVNGTVFNDIITGSNKSDKIYTGAGYDTIIATKGNDVIYANSYGYKTLKFEEESELTYEKKGNDLIITVNGSKDNTVTIKDLFKSTFKGSFLLANGKDLGDENPYLETVLQEEGLLTYDKSDATKGQKIVGTNFGDTFIGSDKSDKIYTGLGNDTIIASKGNDVIYTNGWEGKTLKFKEESELTYEKKGNDLIITVNGSKDDTVTIKNYFKFAFEGSFVLANGEDLGDENPHLETLLQKGGLLTYDKSDETKGQKIVGTDFSETFIGSDKADKIYTGAGDDTIIASKGNDVIYFDGWGEKTLKFEEKSDLTYERKGNDLIITVNGSKDNTVTIKDLFKINDYDSSINIVNGNESEEPSLLETILQEKGLLTYDKSDETKGQKLVGTDFSETFIGSDKADKIYTGGGDDTIIAGKGDDVIYTNSWGEKTFEFKEKEGMNTIYNFEKAGSININFKETNSLEETANVDDSDIGENVSNINRIYTKSGNDLIISAEYNEDSLSDSNKSYDTQVKLSGFFKQRDYIQSNLMSWDEVTDLNVKGSGKIYGTNKNDDIIGSDKKDIIYTGSGQDNISVGKGNDTVYISGSGDKTISIGKDDGNNTIIGAENADNLYLKFPDSRYGNDDDSYSETEETEGNESNKIFDEDIEYTKSNNDLIIKRMGSIPAKKNGQILYRNVVTGKLVTESNSDITAQRYNKKSSEKFYIDPDAYEEQRNMLITEDDYKNLVEEGMNGSYELYQGNVFYIKYKNGSIEFFNEKIEKSVENEIIWAVRDKTFQTTTIKDYFKYPDSLPDLWINDGYITFTGEMSDSDKITIDLSKQKAKKGIYYGTDYNDLIIDNNKNSVIKAGKGNDEIEMGTKGRTTVKIGEGDGVDAITFDYEENQINKKVSVDFTDATEITIKTTDSDENLNVSTSTGEGAIIYALNSFENEKAPDIEIVGSSDENKTFNINNSAKVVSATKTNDTYNITGWSDVIITDKNGDDIYNVDNAFRLDDAKLIISDSKGNDVLNFEQKIEDLTILFNIRKTADKKGNVVGDALYIIGKDSTDLKYGIQMSGIDTIKTSDGQGGYTDVTAPTNEIVQAVQGWLADANSGKGYDSVADAIKANDADLANLIAKFAPLQPQV